MSLGDLKSASPASLDAFYGGEKAAAALSSVLFGDYNPSGRLPMTMYPASFAEQVPLTQMSVTEAPGRTHMVCRPRFAELYIQSRCKSRGRLHFGLVFQHPAFPHHSICPPSSSSPFWVSAAQPSTTPAPPSLSLVTVSHTTPGRLTGRPRQSSALPRVPSSSPLPLALARGSASLSATLEPLAVAAPSSHSGVQ